MSSLDALSLGFRAKYLNHAELTAQLRAWTEAFPDLCRLECLTLSEEGREVWLLTIGREPERLRPAAWMDGNIHASELAGSSVCLAVAEDLLRAHHGEEVASLPEHLRELLTRDVLFYFMPRMCPDGAERVLERHHFVRSNPRDHRIGDHGSFWRHDDVDGDGIARLMRVEDPTGDFVESRATPGLMLPRQVDDAGPYYRVYPEGNVERFDGFTIPKPSFMSDTETDMNRNYPSGWMPEPEQVGAGAFAASEPESRAVTEFAVRHPNIFLWLCMHSFGGVYIRPLGDRPDSKLDPHDAAVFRTVEKLATEHTGYPTVSGFHEFCYAPDKPLHGDLANFAYVERGAIGFVCELWDFFVQVGFETKRPFIKNYEERVSPADIEAMARWDREHNEGRMIGSWQAFEHPQLGPVEVGGYDPLIGVWNPPPERLDELCQAQSRFFLRLASLAPRLVIAKLESAPLGGDLHRVDVVVENRGYLPTNVLGSAKARPFADPVRVRLALGEGLRLESGELERELGHLGGWGGNDRAASPMLARSYSEWPKRKLSWVVRGAGELGVVARSARTGAVDAWFSL